MTTLLIIQGVALLLMFVASAFFSSSEVAYFSLDSLQVRRLEETHPKAGSRVRRLLDNPTQLLSTILIGNTIINIGASVLGFEFFSNLLPKGGELISVIFMTLGLLIFGEFAPKRVAMFWPDATARAYAPILIFLSKLLMPLRLILEKITSSLEDYFKPRGEGISEAEFQTIVTLSGETGLLAQKEHSMMEAILSLPRKYASDAMTPRVDLQGIDMADDADQLPELAQKTKWRFLALYENTFDKIVGLLDVRSYLLDPERRIEPNLHPTVYIPEQCTLDKLLTQFLNEGLRGAIVVDEYGGTAGLITQGDILEEITGEIADEFRNLHAFEQLTPWAWLLDGNLSLEEVNARTDLNLEADAADRLAGWFNEKAEKLPQIGDKITVGPVTATVNKKRHNRITLVMVEIDPEAVPEEEA